MANALSIFTITVFANSLLDMCASAAISWAVYATGWEMVTYLTL